MLSLKNLKARLVEPSIPIIKGIDLEVGAGETHIIIGPNGSGKSTLGRVILGDESYEKTEGSIHFLGEDFEDLDTAERSQKGFFFTFQSPPEIDGVRVKDFLFAAKKSLDPECTSQFKFKKSLEKVFGDLRLPEHFVDREANLGFSGGERKKMEVASLLSLNPRLAFLDEIDSGVDIDTIRSIGKSLKDFMGQGDKSMILVTHSEKLIQELNPTHVHIFTDGKIIESGKSDLISKIHTQGFDQFTKNKKGLNILS